MKTVNSFENSIQNTNLISRYYIDYFPSDSLEEFYNPLLV